MTIQQLLARRAEHEQTVARILAAVGNGSPTAEQATQLRGKHILRRSPGLSEVR